MYCCGHNGFGQLGDGTDVETESPTGVAGGVTFAAVTLGSRHTVGQRGTGTYVYTYRAVGRDWQRDVTWRRGAEDN